MEKYRNSSASLNQNRFLNTGPLYTMCGGSSNSQQQPHQQGPQLLMNANSVGTSTRFQFVPARHSSTNYTGGGGSFSFDMGSIAPIYNSVKTFFSNLLKPKVVAESMSAHDATEKRKCNSAPNIYMGIMSDTKCAGGDFDKSCFVDLTDYNMLAKLSTSTKSFSDYNLPVSTAKINCSPRVQENISTVDVSSSFEKEEAQVHPTKEIITVEEKTTVPVVNSPPSPVPVPLLQPKKKNNCRTTMPNVPIRPRRQCSDGKRTSKSKKKSTRSGKNKKEKGRHELALKIHEDVETENEAMSADEWDEPLVIITAAKTAEPTETVTSKVVCFSKDDFPAMPDHNSLNAKNCPASSKQTWELPRLSHCFSALNGRKQRQISECDSEDSFIVFDNDDNKFTPSSVESNQSICDRIRSTLAVGRQRQISESSDDDFICFELEHSDNDSDSDEDGDVDCDDEDVTSDSDCESVSSGDAPDSGFGDKKVRFNLKPVVHILRTWRFAYQQAREGKWEQIGRDRVRFQNRIRLLESTLAPILEFDHRQKIYCDRFLTNAVNEISDSAIEE